MKGAVPIPYIIALLLGIAIIAIIGYWFFVLSGQWGLETNLAQCKTKATTYCAIWSQTGYASDNDEPNFSLGWFSEQYPECTSYLSQLGFSDKSSASTDSQACESIMGSN